MFMRATRTTIAVVAAVLVSAPVSALADAVDDYNAGVERADAGDFQGAVQFMTLAIEAGTLDDEDLSDAYYNRGLYYGHLEQLEDSISDYERAVELNPNHTAAWSSMCYVQEEWGELDLAMPSCDRALQTDPYHAPTYNIRALIWWQKGDFDHAEADFSRSIELQPENWANYLNRGAFYEDNGRTDTARADYQRAYELAPDWARARYSDTFRSYGITQ
jgi:tetratricopeptide (TPR) repeat protein